MEPKVHQLLERIIEWLAGNHPARIDRRTSLRVGVLLGEAFRQTSLFRWGYVRVEGTPMLTLLSPERTHAVAPVDCLREALYVGERDLRQMFDRLETRHLPPAAHGSLTLFW